MFQNAQVCLQPSFVWNVQFESLFSRLYYFHKDVALFPRLVKLLNEIMQENENKTLIFVETKRKADDIARRMKRDG